MSAQVANIKYKDKPDFEDFGDMVLRGDGGTGYVRDRPFEFAARDLPRERLLAEIAQTIAVVERVLPGLSEEAVAAPYPDVLGGLRPPTGLFLHHLACHLSHHLGQAGYLRRTLTGDNRSSGTISMESLAGAL